MTVTKILVQSVARLLQLLCLPCYLPQMSKLYSQSLFSALHGLGGIWGWTLAYVLLHCQEGHVPEKISAEHYAAGLD